MSVRKPKIEKWVLSPHAVQRMVERDISIAELEMEKNLWLVITVMI